MDMQVLGDTWVYTGTVQRLQYAAITPICRYVFKLGSCWGLLWDVCAEWQQPEDGYADCHPVTEMFFNMVWNADQISEINEFG